MARTKAAAKKSHRSRGRHIRNRGRLTKFRNKFEDKLGDDLTTRGIVYGYESLQIEYTQVRKYKPDFIIKSKDGTRQIIVEAKGLFEAEDRRKHLDVKRQHPDYDIRFVFYADYKLRKGAKSTYSQWCEKNGFQYAIKEIPDSWLQELDLLGETDEQSNIN